MTLTLALKELRTKIGAAALAAGILATGALAAATAGTGGASACAI
jgi:hypothetical protein